MTELPHPWGAYLRHQEELAHRRDVDDRVWGLEAAMNRLLDGALAPEEVDRAVDSGGRKERYRRALRSKRWEGQLAIPTMEDALDAGQVLEDLGTQMCDADWCLLVEVGEGYRYCEIATSRGVTTGAIRTRVCRLRRCFRPSVARVLGWPDRRRRPRFRDV